MKKVILVFIAFQLIIPFISFAQKLIVIRPRPESEMDTRFDYQWEVLEAALEATINEGPYEVRLADKVMVENRVAIELMAGSGKINIMRDNSSQKMDRDFLPIRVPLKKGAMGWRILLINKDRQKDFSQIKTLADLKKIVIGQGKGWATVEVLRSNGFEVITATKYESLFAMLMVGRFDAFNRGIFEGPIELEERKDKYPNMTIEKNLILRYNFLEIFFVHKKDAAMAARIERGLNKIIKNGILDQIFDKYFGKLLAQLCLNKRIIIDIDNPHLGTAPSFHREEYWLSAYLRKKGICEACQK
jgi:hypothetical protein